MSAKATAVVTVCTLFLLMAVINRNWTASASAGIETTEEGQHLLQRPNNREEGQAQTENPSPGEEQRQRQKELARETFLRLNPTPWVKANDERGGEAPANANGERRGHKVDEDSGRLLLRDGDTVMAFAADDDTLIKTVKMNNCRGDLFKHKVRMPGCRPKTIVNRFCHGNCASFYIPRMRSKKLKATFQSCAACVPIETDLVQVQLDCPGHENGHLNQTVVRVKRCACRNIVLEEEEEEGEAEEVTTGERAETA